MSIGYDEHSRTRYLRNHYEIYDYRKDKDFEKAELEAGRAKREAALEARQQARREALEALIEANRVYAPSSRLTQQIEEDSRQKRLEKEQERERKAKIAADRAAADRLKERLSNRSTFHHHLSSSREERTSRVEKEAQFHKIDKERRAKEREARQYAKSGLKTDSDSEEESKPTTSTRRPASATATHRLVSKYRDSGASYSSSTRSRGDHLETSSSRSRLASSSRSAIAEPSSSSDNNAE